MTSRIRAVCPQLFVGVALTSAFTVRYVIDPKAAIVRRRTVADAAKTELAAADAGDIRRLEQRRRPKWAR
jgi:hypothetical protein